MRSSDTESKVRNEAWVVIALLVLVCLTIYGQSLTFGFINLDDNLYVYENPMVASGLTGSSLRWAFTTFHSANWHPLTWVSHMLDASLFGLNPGPMHFENVLFHALNSILAFVVFRRLTGDLWKSAIVAFLFAVHPAHVESVAWISERKDLISATFWLLTMLAYERYARDEAAADTSPAFTLETFRSPRYLLVVLFLGLGLMTKPMLVTLPFVLLLIDFWPLSRLKAFGDLRPLITEKVPLFVLSIASSIVTIAAQSASGAVESFEVRPVTARLMNALTSYVKYISMLFYPHAQGVWYPMQNVDFKLATAALLLLTAISILCIRFAKSRPYLLFGWLWFLGTLVPVIGIVQVGGQSLADRYTYIPFFGLFVIVVWGGDELLERIGLHASWRTVGTTVVILILMSAAYIQTTYWRGSETLYVRTLNVTSDNFLISHNLCYTYVVADRFDDAEPLCERSITVNPHYSDSWNTLGILRLKQNRLPESEQIFRNVLGRWPGYLPAYANLAAVLVVAQKPEEAEKYLEAATVLAEGSVDRSRWIEPVKNLADLYAKQNKMEKAAENYARAIFLEPQRADLRLAVASALYQTRKYDEALPQVQAAIALDPNNADAFHLAGKIYAAKGMQTDAVQMFERAIAIRPGFSEARANLSEITGGR